MKDQEIYGGILKLVEETFTERDVLDVALYIMSSMAVSEAVQQGIMGRKQFVEGLPPQALDIANKYDSAITNNKFYLENFTLLKSFVIMDKIKLAAAGKLAKIGQVGHDARPIKKLEHLLHSKLDSLVIVAFLWKGYDFAVDFMTKARMVMELTPAMQKFIKETTEEEN